jgi:hypothetical protein
LLAGTKPSLVPSINKNTATRNGGDKFTALKIKTSHGLCGALYGTRQVEEKMFFSWFKKLTKRCHLAAYSDGRDSLGKAAVGHFPKVFHSM